MLDLSEEFLWNSSMVKGTIKCTFIKKTTICMPVSFRWKWKQQRDQNPQHLLFQSGTISCKESIHSPHCKKHKNMRPKAAKKPKIQRKTSSSWLKKEKKNSTKFSEHSGKFRYTVQYMDGKDTNAKIKRQSQNFQSQYFEPHKNCYHTLIQPQVLKH